jgi:hypothetical protein
VRGGKGTVLVEFLDNGERVTCSFRALRRTASEGATVRRTDERTS